MLVFILMHKSCKRLHRDAIFSKINYDKKSQKIKNHANTLKVISMVLFIAMYYFILYALSFYSLEALQHIPAMMSQPCLPEISLHNEGFLLHRNVVLYRSRL